MREPSRRVQFLTDLAAVVDRDTAAELRHGELLENNAAVAALREEAEALAASLGEAGLDYAPSLDFRRRLEEELKARREGRPHRQDSQELTVPTIALPDPDDDEPTVERIRLQVVDFGAPTQTGSRPPVKAQAGRGSLWLPLLLLLLLGLGIAWQQGLVGRAAKSRTSQPAPSHPQVPLPAVKHGLSLVAIQGERTQVTGLAETALARVGKGDVLELQGALTTGAFSSVTVEREDGLRIVLGPDSRLEPHAEQITIAGAARITLPATETTIRLSHVELKGKGATLLVMEDGPTSQVAALRGSVMVEPPQSAALALPALSQVTVTARGAAVLRPLHDHRAFLEAIALAEAGLGRLVVEGKSPQSPMRNDTQVEVMGDLALVSVSEQFAKPDGTVARYHLPLPAFARLVATRHGDPATTPFQGSSDGLAVAHDAMVALDASSDPQLRFETRYLVPLTQDGLGTHLPYSLPPSPATRVTVQVNLLEPGELSGAGMGTVLDKNRRRLSVSERNLTESLRLRVRVAPRREEGDGAVHWAVPSPALSREQPLQPGIKGHAAGAAILTMMPVTDARTATSTPPQLVIIDFSRSMAGAGMALSAALLDELRELLPNGAKVNVLGCSETCVGLGVLDAPMVGAEPLPLDDMARGTFDLSSAFENAAAALQREVGDVGGVHLWLITDRGPSTGDLSMPAALRTATVSVIGVGDRPLLPVLTQLSRAQGGLQLEARQEREVRSAVSRLLRVSPHSTLRQGLLTVAENAHGPTRWQEALSPLLAGERARTFVPMPVADGATVVLQGRLSVSQPELERRYSLGLLPPTFPASPYNAWLMLEAASRAPVPSRTKGVSADEDTLSQAAALVAAASAELGRARRSRGKPTAMLLPPSVVDAVLSRLAESNPAALERLCIGSASEQCLASARAATSDGDLAAHARLITQLIRSGQREQALEQLSNLVDGLAGPTAVHGAFAQLLWQAGQRTQACAQQRHATALDAGASADLPCDTLTALAVEAAQEEAASRGDLQVTASWSNAPDAYDLALVDAAGRSVTWLAPALGGFDLGAVRNPFADAGEELTVEELSPGLYRLEIIARTDAPVYPPVTLAVRLLGRTQPFNLHHDGTPGARAVSYVFVP